MMGKSNKNKNNQIETYSFNHAIIGPHFLYNSLETINCLALSLGAIEICKVTSALAKMFHYAMNDKHQSTKLEDEISFTNEYLTIQSIRYNEALTFGIMNSPSINNKMCSKFLIQKIVDKIIYYCIEKNDMDCHIRISGETVGECAMVTIQNNMRKLHYNQLSKEDLMLFKKHILNIDGVSENHIKPKLPNEQGIDKYNIQVTDMNKKEIVIKIELQAR